MGRNESTQVTPPEPFANVLVTGVCGGLGRYLHEAWPGPGLCRENAVATLARCRRKGVDVIIHCAANGRRDITTESLAAYMEDNLLLTQKLLAIPHKKFVYVSSVDVYPPSTHSHTEEEVIALEDVRSMYARMKLMSEALVRAVGGNYLILRPTALLGPYARVNSAIRIVRDIPGPWTLSADSRFNYISYEDVRAFLRRALRRDLRGIVNLASSRNVRLGDVARVFKRQPVFGGFRYDVGRVCNRKCARVCGRFAKTSMAAIKEFARSPHV